MCVCTYAPISDAIYWYVYTHPHVMPVFSHIHKQISFEK